MYTLTKEEMEPDKPNAKLAWVSSNIQYSLYAGNEALSHRLNMELDLQSLFGLHVHSCTHWLRPRTPPPSTPRSWAHIRGRYWSAKIDDIFL